MGSGVGMGCSNSCWVGGMVAKLKKKTDPSRCVQMRGPLFQAQGSDLERIFAADASCYRLPALKQSACGLGTGPNPASNAKRDKEV